MEQFFCVEFESILEEYDLLEFWNPETIRSHLPTFRISSIQNVRNRFFCSELDRIKQSKSAKFLCSKIQSQNFVLQKSPIAHIPINHKGTWLLRILSGNLPFNWKNKEGELKHTFCPLCGKIGSIMRIPYNISSSIILRSIFVQFNFVR